MYRSTLTAIASGLALAATIGTAAADGAGDNWREVNFRSNSATVASPEARSVRSASRARTPRQSLGAAVLEETVQVPRANRRTRTASREPFDAPSYSGASGGGSVGMASFYWQPQRVASGGWFNPNAMTAAHKTLPFGTRVRVTHLGNGRSVVVTINDRGPFIAGRIIDLSKAAAGVINMQGQGVAQVRMEVLGR